MDNYFNNTSLVGLIIKWRKHLVIITLIAAILGAIFSGPFFITPLYKSEAVAYPSNIMSYSDESETEQMLQIIQGQDITDSIIEKFNLLEVYKIDPNYKYMRTTVLYKYSQNVKIKKTPYEAISITVRDKDPERAAAMAYEILNQYDLKVGNLHKLKYSEVVEMYEQQLADKKHVIDSLQARMRILGTEYGLVDYTMQSQEIMRGYLRTVMGASTTNINTKAVDEIKHNMANYGGEMITLIEMLEAEATSFVSVKLDLETAQRFIHAKLTYSNIISKPFPSDKKVFPVRWIIVALSGLGAFLLSLLIIFLLDNKTAFLTKEA